MQSASWSERLLRAASSLHPLGMVVELRPDGLATLRPATTTTAAAGSVMPTLPASANRHITLSSGPLREDVAAAVSFL